MAGDPTVMQGDVIIRGALAVQGQQTAGASSVADAQVAANAGIAATKLKQQRDVHYAQGNGATVSETKFFFRCYGLTGTVLYFMAGAITPAVGAATVTFDLKKNGVSILSAPISISSATAARSSVAAVLLAGAALVVGDFLEIVVVSTLGGGTAPLGIFAHARINEDGVS